MATENITECLIISVQLHISKHCQFALPFVSCLLLWVWLSAQSLTSGNIRYHITDRDNIRFINSWVLTGWLLSLNTFRCQLKTYFFCEILRSSTQHVRDLLKMCYIILHFTYLFQLLTWLGKSWIALIMKQSCHRLMRLSFKWESLDMRGLENSFSRLCRFGILALALQYI